MKEESGSMRLLRMAGVFYCDPDDDPEVWGADSYRTINLNDTFAWALSYGEVVEEAEEQEVARLFTHYGMAGLWYWAFVKGEWKAVEFEDVQRAIDFVRNEERIRKEVPDYNKRAYHKESYTLGLHEQEQK